jgi:DNA-binding Xre family transcriptional regulator
MGLTRKHRRSKPAPSAQVTFRLKRVLDEHHAKGHGTITKLVQGTGLERHLVSNLIQGRVHSISWDTLGRICQYLHQECGVLASDLPRLLFGFEASEFWAMIAESKVVIALGVRSLERVEPRWVNAYDAYLLGVLLRQLFGLGHEQLSELEQYLVRSGSSEKDLQRTMKDSLEIYQAFCEMSGDRALVCVGSVKSNPVSERVIADVFRTAPFVSQDGVRSAKHRSCPLFVQFRHRDPRSPSCHGGMKLSRTRKQYQPGIHFETKAGGWDYCPSTETEDAALVVYSYRPYEGTMEIVLGGFSGRATGALALELGNLEREVWPPNYVENNLKVGAFIIRFRFNGPEEEEPGAKPILVKPSETEVIRLDTEVLARRLS